MTYTTIQQQEAHRQATWLELLFDLVFVAAIDIITEELALLRDGTASFQHILHFVLSFTPMWWIWATYTLFSNRYDDQSITHTIHTILITGLLIILSAGLNHPLTENFYDFVICYLIIRVIFCIGYLLIYWSKQEVYAKKTALAILLAAMIASVALIVNNNHLRIAIVIFSIFCEMLLHMYITYKCTCPPVHRKHLFERLGILTVIILGQFVISISHGINEIELNFINIMVAISGFIFIALLWRVYFGFSHLIEKATRIKQGLLLVYLHLLFHIGLIILATLIKHSILLDIKKQTFILFASIGLPLLYFGRQLAYMHAFPVGILSFFTSCTAGMLVSFLSLFFVDVNYAMFSMSAGIFVYVVLIKRWFLGTHKKDIMQYLMGTVKYKNKSMVYYNVNTIADGKVKQYTTTNKPSDDDDDADNDEDDDEDDDSDAIIDENFIDLK